MWFGLAKEGTLSDSGLTIGVIGAGRLGREHVRVYKESDSVKKVFVYDQIADRAKEVAEKYGAAYSDSLEALIADCEAVSICTPASNHYEVASMAFEKGLDVMVEKPIAATCSEAKAMIEKAAEYDAVLQVGHIERFNGAFEAASELIDHPRFIESHRLGTFSIRGTDVSVVQDLMIHDIDLILSMLWYTDVSEVRASGASVLTESPDIVNTRIEFENGCVANVTASRISREPLRKIRFFQTNRYISVDLRNKDVEAFEKATPVGRNGDNGIESRFFRRIPVEVDRAEPLKKEIDAFLNSVKTRSKPPVTGEEALKALEVAEMILENL